MQTVSVEIPLFWLGVAGIALASFLVGALLLLQHDERGSPMERLQKRLGLETANGGIFFIGMIFWMFLFLLLFFGLALLIVDTLRFASPSTTIAVTDWRFTLAKMAALTAVLGAVVAFPLTLIRIGLTRQDVYLSEQGLITDRLNKAVEGLGAEKQSYRMGRDLSYVTAGKLYREFEFRDQPVDLPAEVEELQRTEWKNFSVSEPVLEVRLGAIYALERIAKDSLRDHLEIVEILCSYVRENSPCKELLPSHIPERRVVPRIDIQAATTVLGRRSEEGRQLEASQEKRLDLKGCDLSGADFSKGNFFAANLQSSKLEGAIFEEADLRGSLLFSCNLRYATFWNADLTGSRLDDATVSPTFDYNSINRAKITGACLFGTNLSGVFLQRAFREHLTVGNRGTQFAGYSDEKREVIFNKLNEASLEDEVNDDLNEFKYWSPFSNEDLANGRFLRKARKALDLQGWPYD
ncbi:pentapeptide repeat-containing protein [Marimonas sp. MJW-29]|uniref:Pentapeptide repeat-containing protein n=1 Tax=Sulfitobacter sediminis TaxID=3234186 RepID=A0ABV3RQZ4_9RHOB